MGFGKFLPFLALGFLVLYQVGMIQAAPFRSAVEDSSLSEEEEDLLLAILVKEFMKKMASEKEQAALDSRFPLDSDFLQAKLLAFIFSNDFTWIVTPSKPEDFCDGC
ncbi:Calcitonin [Myotis brandtii]|uniref:Calcitonin n=1 Tax=Myotis brandtii TaxID=109478 RepID=S7QFH6_MYOBR|nr:Calcitonin [Myotis brandtii]